IFPEKKDGPGGDGDTEFITMILIPPLHASRWDRGVAEVVFSGNTLRIDTVKLEVSLKKAAPIKNEEGKTVHAIKTPDGKYIHSRYALGTDVEVRTLVLPKKEGDKSFRLIPGQQVELLLPGKEPRVLVPDAEMVIATPSPNGEWLALRCFPHKEGPMS